MHFDLGYTSPINPAGAEPKLSVSQVWKGLVQKCRAPQAFVPAISECEILSEDDNGLKRMVTFQAGFGPPAGKVEEHITFQHELRADFLMVGKGSQISNIITPGSGESDLYLTYTFSFNEPTIEPGTPEAEAKLKQYTEQAKGVVPRSVDEIRDMVKQGKI
ncbi:uncharacterized protein L969DRAFT_53097 [Mixia osmundae IAM 14324]|uniref:Bet v I/Major latex protein domain-containing protein n=1 Tax=Mixia osmundae (strain CBS 9802 / IAM 14324 / JCM 22182 / KY 12970) TaxID=764103 RepID=G7DUU3_MIXOS|nr:uncharacterized protein L969DRAFT_53097 [Mixia osmundae IAM 14324]KEI37429.1 hypothetical protein L969DRAFT_53097 [Mixia osmundae IAM 14324]GAA94353.1 hypothetical protein E5Q_01004 [Mixia osmundae IAM 14324]